MTNRRRFPNTMDAIRPPHCSKILTPTLEASELVLVLCAVKSTRNKAIIFLLVDNGVRAEELCSLLKQNIKEKTIIAEPQV
jgi:integrase